MKLRKIIEKLQLKVLTGQENLEAEVTGGYTSDLLSDVIANSKNGNLWITLQTHQNIIAVAKLKDLSGIIIVNKREPDGDTLQKAKEENVLLLGSEEKAFDVSGKLYGLIGSKD
ncbi:MAG: serine kinase [Candidatus Aminicenantes bacterium]|nr:serine kinase [Candidatus Aminicenantes bacterium]